MLYNPIITKIILHGGLAQKESALNKEFYKTILSNLTGDINIALVYFAIEESLISQNYDTDTKHFLESSGNRNIKFTIVNESNINEVFANSDLIYIGGGFTSLICEKKDILMKALEGFKGSTIVAESAGANILSKYGYSPSAKQVYEGIGLIPELTIPHYIEGDENHISKRYLEIPKNYLKEYEYKVFEI